jgi:hypothetical protein
MADDWIDRLTEQELRELIWALIRVDVSGGGLVGDTHLRVTTRVA